MEAVLPFAAAPASSLEFRRERSPLSIVREHVRVQRSFPSRALSVRYLEISNNKLMKHPTAKVYTSVHCPGEWVRV